MRSGRTSRAWSADDLDEGTIGAALGHLPELDLVVRPAASSASATS